jgi:hypothetical protein
LPLESPEDAIIRPAALSGSLAIVTEDAIVARGQTVRFFVWLNLTGVGSIPMAWVNVTMDASLVPDLANVTIPSGCGSQGSLAWQCSGLRAGSHPWTLPTQVDPSAQAGRPYNATVEASILSGATYTSLPSGSASVFVSGAEVEIVFRDAPSAARPGERVRFVVDAVNLPRAAETAYNVTLTVIPDGALILAPATILNTSVAALTPGSYQGLRIDAILASNASTGARVGVRAVLAYEDFNFVRVGPLEATATFEVLSPEIFPPASVLTALVAFAIAVGGTVLVVLVAGQRRVKIDDLFLMHRNGILIRHDARETSLAKDDDLVASMLVAIQDFVRDSFRSEATLDEFSFGRRSAAFVRGRHVVLAAILSRGKPGYVIPQLRAAADDLEEAHGPDLAVWDGRVGRLPRSGDILKALLAGRYRATQFWSAWIHGLREGAVPTTRRGDRRRETPSDNVYPRESHDAHGAGAPGGSPRRADRRAAVGPERPDTDAVVRARLREKPDDPDALFVLAAMHARDGQIRSGLDILDRVLRIDPRYPGAWIFKAKLHRMDGQPTMAERAEERAERETS